MKKEKDRILCFLPVLGQPRHAKRITMLQRKGFTVEAVAFERDYHKGRIPNCPITSLGKISNGQYFRRIFVMALAIFSIRRAIHRNHLVYAFGPDMALLAIIANLGLGRPVVFEVGDIRWVQVATGVTGIFARVIDRFVCKYSKLLVTTSQGFIDGYYRKYLNTKIPAIVLENKQEKLRVDTECSKTFLPRESRALHIGYFGLLRCNWSWQVLEALALARPNDIKIIVAGYPLEPIDLVERAARLPNIEFRGEYRSPQDLPSLYGDVDLVWACYPYPKKGECNWRWARTNRFYESCYFKKPMIVLRNSGDAQAVEHYDIGLLVKYQAVDALVDITPEEIARWTKNISQLPLHVYEYSTEIDELGNTVRKIINNNLKCVDN